MIRELWPSHGELPYEEEPLPPQFSQVVDGDPKVVKKYTFGTEKKLVVYDRAHPEIRLVLLLDSAYDHDGESWQPIMQSRVERDRGVDPGQSRTIEQRLWDEVCQVERRGRPRGTGHPKRQRLLDYPIAAKDVDRLREAGLGDKDLQILFDRSRNMTFKKIGQSMRISTQAVHKRWQNRILPALQKVNPEFSPGSFKLHSIDSN